MFVANIALTMEVVHSFEGYIGIGGFEIQGGLSYLTV
jgi:hypothetical protein